MKIAYVIVGEDLDTPLLRRQVLELLGKIKEKNEDINITIFNFQGVLSILNHYRSLRQISADLERIGIRHRVIPNICPWPVPNIRFKQMAVGWRPYSVWNRFAAIIFSNTALPWFFVLNKMFGYQLFHCRSYVSTLGAIKYKRIVKNVKVLFDPRSDFPEEGVTAKFWNEGDEDFNYWKLIEKKLLEESDAVALIGPTYLNHYQKHRVDFKYFFVPNNVDVEFFQRNEDRRIKIRWDLQYSKDTIVFVYLGALNDEGWHRTSFYEKFHRMASEAGLNFALLILTPYYCKPIIQERFKDFHNVNVISPKYDEVGHYLSAGDVGLMFLHKEKVAVGTKIGEYLCSGLPCLVNSNCVGAAELINNNPLFGRVISLGLGDKDVIQDGEMGGISLLLEGDPSREAAVYFSIEKIASIYASKYREI